MSSRIKPARGTDQWKKAETILDRKSTGKIRKLMGCSGDRLIGTEDQR